ncbi:hypothetical protein THAOC_32494, partial [Thalassiosira oceanica]
MSHRPCWEAPPGAFWMPFGGPSRHHRLERRLERQCRARAERDLLILVDCSTNASATEGVQTAATIVLPVNWTSSIDAQTGKRYYWDRVTRETTWIRPRSPSGSPRRPSNLTRNNVPTGQ